MNIRIIYHGSIYDRNGCAKVIRSFAENGQLFFALTGHDVTVFDKSFADALFYQQKKQDNSKRTNPSVSPSKLLKRRVKAFFGAAVMKKYAESYWGTKKMMDRRYWNGKAKDIIEKYYTSGLDDDAYIFHDIFTCWAYIDHCRRNNLKLKKYILVLHIGGILFEGFYIRYPNLKDSWYFKVMNSRAEACYKHAQRIVFVSKRSVKTFTEKHPVYSNKVTLVYNGINDEPSVNPVFDGKIRMVTVGSVYIGKNQIMQIDCLKRIRRQCDATLTVIGAGDDLEKCKQRAKDLGVEQWVGFLGSIDGVADELQKCNLFVMSSLNEGLPIAAIEALRAKLPVVLTDVGGCRELIEDNGYLVHPSIDEITDAVLDFGKDVEKQKRMSEASYRLFKEKFTVDAMIKGYSEIIKEVFG